MLLRYLKSYIYNSVAELRINKNIAALERDKANYNALKEKNRIKDFKKLYNEIKHDWRKYDNYQPPIQGGGNEMGSQEYL